MAQVCWLGPKVSSHRPLFGNPAKSGSGRISSKISQTSAQLQYVQLIMDKTNAADLSSGVFTISICFTRTIKMQNSLAFHKFRQKLANSDLTKEALYSLFIVADSIVDAISFIGILFCVPTKQYTLNMNPAPAGLEFLNPARSSFGHI